MVVPRPIRGVVPASRDRPCKRLSYCDDYILGCGLFYYQFMYAWFLEILGLSIGEMHFIQGGIAQDLRTNGRKRLTYRPFVVETVVIAQANGSARVNRHNRSHCEC
ncbi:Exoribonuclease, phosphorolytic domain 1 [Artemisia annua]|uniref:Exoribonuclease, phosphorolytic domain 1 n=1 Tax=Artemisia annua TaxID=35608 RepID=A0A2U1KBG9_ARTAN|nr:Exoribonuclease, phosphorolytic domain 1 [Artemisia annua]